MVQSIQCLSHKHADLSSVSAITGEKNAMMACTCQLSVQKEEAAWSLKLTAQPT